MIDDMKVRMAPDPPVRTGTENGRRYRPRPWEFHPLNDMIAAPDTDRGVRLDVARRRGAGEAPHGVKPAREVDLVGCSALDLGPAVSLAAAGEGQMNAAGLGLCGADAHEPAVMRSGNCDGDSDKKPPLGPPERMDAL